MKECVCTCIAGLILLSLIGCDEVFEYRPPRELTVVEQQLADSTQDFGFELFRNTVETSGQDNLFISPMSTSYGLGMALAGANGTTAEQLTEVLGHGDASAQEIHEAYWGLLGLVMFMDPDVQFELANSLWIHKHSDEKKEVVNESYPQICAAHYRGTVTELDFTKDESTKTINKWVKKRTEGKMQSILDEPLNPEALMYLVNGLYYKGDWTYKFGLEESVDNNTTQMMVSTDQSFNYVQSEDLAAVDLLYGHGLLVMTLLMPAGNLNEFIGVLNKEKWQSIRKEMRAGIVDLKIPKFDVEFSTNLVEALKQMGLELPFGAEADFTGISDKKDLFINELRHKTHIAVDEQGTLDVPVVSVDSADSDKTDQVEITFDNPIVVVIHDTHSGAIAFIGKVTDPNAE